MSPWWRRKPHPFAGRDMLDLVPRPVVGVEPDPETGHLVALLPRFRDGVFGRLLQPRLPAARRFVRVRLDARGTFLWRQLDGRRTLRDLVPLYLDAFPDDGAEAAERVSIWAYAGYEHGLIGLED